MTFKAQYLSRYHSYQKAPLKDSSCQLSLHWCCASEQGAECCLGSKRLLPALRNACCKSHDASASSKPNKYVEGLDAVSFVQQVIVIKRLSNNATELKNLLHLVLLLANASRPYLPGSVFRARIPKWQLHDAHLAAGSLLFLCLRLRAALSGGGRRCWRAAGHGQLRNADAAGPGAVGVVR